MSTSLNDVLSQPAIKTVSRDASTLVNATTVFNVVGGPIIIKQIIAICITANDTTASTLQFSADGTDGAAATISGATATLASAAAGTIVATVPGTLATAPAIYANGVGILGALAGGIVVPAGVIKTTIGVGSTTGTWQLVLRYESLGGNVEPA
jgi:hypothetical protein